MHHVIPGNAYGLFNADSKFLALFQGHHVCTVRSTVRKELIIAPLATASLTKAVLTRSRATTSVVTEETISRKERRKIDVDGENLGGSFETKESRVSKRRYQVRCVSTQ